MQTIRWIGLGVSNALTKTVVHFFPSAGNVTAPYPCQCKLSVFGPTLGRKSVVLDGARLSQPDGVKLEAAFPALNEGLPSMFGISVELSSQQQRIDLTSSSCIVELTSAGPSVMYVPHEYKDDEQYLPETGVAFKDAFNTSSLVMINGTSDLFRPPLNPGFVVEGLAPDCVMEIELGDNFFKDTTPREHSWGLGRMKEVRALHEIPSAVGLYLIHRDVASKRPITIVPL